jgi:hypothetical protein
MVAVGFEEMGCLRLESSVKGEGDTSSKSLNHLTYQYGVTSEKTESFVTPV